MISCNGVYEEISDEEFQNLTIQDTLVKNSEVFVFKVGKSSTDKYSNLLVKSKSKEYYKFDYDCELENDSIILSYYPAFITDDEGEFRKNGIWVYAKFSSNGTFPLNSDVIEFSPDSIPKNWNKTLPKKEGIYLYKYNALKLISKEQSEEKFKEKKINGFYFFPNKGRLFNRININKI